MAGGYPIVLDVRQRLVVVVGGGNVGTRKAQGVLSAGARRVRVVSPEFDPDLPAEVERVRGPYEPSHLLGASLVFAATSSAEVNDAVVRDARAIGALVCRADADEDDAGDFSTPAVVRCGEVLVAVSTCGNPALSALVRDRLAQAIDPRWSAMAGAMRALRGPIRASGVAPAQRREIFHELCTEAALDVAARDGADGVRRWLSQRFAILLDTRRPDQQ